MMILWSKQAQQHLDDIFDYILDNHPQSAVAIYDCIREHVERLATYPALGRPGRVDGTRELVVPGSAYIVPYRVRRGHIEILAVLHGSQQWPDKLGNT